MERGAGERWVDVILRGIREHWLLGAGVLLALAARWLLLPVVLGSDISGFILPWYKQTIQHGRLHSLGLEISNYAPPYMYLLTLSTLLPFKPVFAIKSIAVLFDLVAALAVFKITRVFHRQGPVAAVAAVCFMLCPTVLINSAVWGQSDVIYAAFLLFALFLALTARPLASVFLFSVAASFKMQALFFLPALGVVFIARGFSILYFLLTPAAYLVAAIPPILLGRSAANVLSIYSRQFTDGGLLALNAASVYQWLPVSSVPQAQAQGGVVFAAAACALSGYVLLRLPRRPHTRADLLNAALFMAALPPFLLPQMHERYAFASDTLACIVPFVTPLLALPSLLFLGASFASYGPYLGSTWMPLSYAALLNLAALFLVARHLSRRLGINDALASSDESDESNQEASVPHEPTFAEPERMTSSADRDDSSRGVGQPRRRIFG